MVLSARTIMKIFVLYGVVTYICKSPGSCQGSDPGSNLGKLPESGGNQGEVPVSGLSGEFGST